MSNDDNTTPRPRTRMSKDANRLTAKKVEKLHKPGRYHDGHGLLLQITRSGSKSWLLRYGHNGKERMLGLGACHTVSLKEARQRARTARLMLLDGVDPIDARRGNRLQAQLAAARATTFRDCAEQYIETHQASRKSAIHREQWRQSMQDYVFPIVGPLPIAEIDEALVMRVLVPIWSRFPSTARRVRSRIEKVLDAAKVQKYRQGENPARWRGHLETLLPSKLPPARHFAAMKYEDLPAFLTKLRARDGVVPRALEFLIRTAARTGEVLGARWSEIDLPKRL